MNAMPAIHIRDVPDATVAALKERARRNGRSMQRELREILDAAAAEPPAEAAQQPLQLVTVRTSGTATWRREEIYGDDGR
jgi:plasmid stability protein